MTSPEVDLAPRIELRLPSGSEVVICSDLHLGAVPTEASLRMADDLAQRLSTWTGPGAVILNGDCFERSGLAVDDAMGAALDAHPDLAQALSRMAGGEGPHVVVTTGRADRWLAQPGAAYQAKLRLGAEVASAVDLVFATDDQPRVVRVEHGHHFDPRLPEAGDSELDDYQLALRLLPGLTERSFLEDAAGLVDPDDFGDYLGSRVVYRALGRRAWWLLLPLVVGLALHVPVVAGVLEGVNALDAVGPWFFAVASGVVVDVVLLGIVSVIAARRLFRSVRAASPAVGREHRNDPPRSAGQALCSSGFSGFVTGHSHQPELTPVPGGFYANSGCGTTVVVRRPARLGLPPVYAAVTRRSWIELESGRVLRAHLVLGEAELPGATRLERIVQRRRQRRPVAPERVASLPGGAGWPLGPESFGDPGRRVRVRRVASFGALLVAAVGVVSAVTPPSHERLRALLEFLPVELPQAASASLVFGSTGLALLARGLRRGHRLAWAGALAVLGASTLLHVVKGGDIEEALLTAFAGIWLAAKGASFPVRTDGRTIRRSLLLAATVAAGALAGSVALVFTLGERDAGDALTSLRALAERLAGNSSLALPVNTPFVTPALTATGVAIVAAVLWLVLGPRRPRALSSAQRGAELQRAREIVASHGGDTLAYFALRDDKEWFFSGRSLVAYSVRNGVCLVAPDPIGPPEEWAYVWREFAEFADRSGWSVAVVGAQPGWVAVYEAAGMQAIYMGDEAIIDCPSFSLQGGTMKGLRGAYNRVGKAGYRVEFFDPARLDPPLEASLRAMMADSRQGEVERGFSMTLSRLFDPADTGLLLSVAFGPEDEPAAFCHWVPSADIDGWSLDLMRRSGDPDLPNGVTDFVVIETIEHVRSQRQWGIGLNFAVLRAVVAGERAGISQNLQRRVLHKFSETMQIESLWRYNEKFQPYWRPRYVIVDAVERVPTAGIAIADAESIWELPVLGRFLGRRAERG